MLGPQRIQMIYAGKYTVLAIILLLLFSDDFSSFVSSILASLSKQTILFYLYNLLQAIIALLLPAFHLTTQVVSTQHRPFV